MLMKRPSNVAIGRFNVVTNASFPKPFRDWALPLSDYRSTALLCKWAWLVLFEIGKA